jgi:hypothetical protein
MPRRTGLIVEVPEAEPAIGALRLRHDSSAALGVPAHITILSPFVPPEAVDETAIAAVLSPYDSFDYALARVETFPPGDVTYLAPVPPGPFIELTKAFAGRWPDYPPYEGAHATVVPHLTVSDSGYVTFDVTLPIAARADAVTLLEELPDGRWTTKARFPLGGRARASPPGPL